MRKGTPTQKEAELAIGSLLHSSAFISYHMHAIMSQFYQQNVTYDIQDYWRVLRPRLRILVWMWSAQTLAQKGAASSINSG